MAASRSTIFTFSQPQPKKRVWMKKESPFPVPIASETGCPPGVHNWHYYTGWLRGDHVFVTDKSDMDLLWKMGFFGKSSLPRGGPAKADDSKKQGQQRPRKFGWWADRTLQLVSHNPKSVSELIREGQQAAHIAILPPGRKRPDRHKRPDAQQPEVPSKKRFEEKAGPETSHDLSADTPCDQSDDAWKSGSGEDGWGERGGRSGKIDPWDTATPEESAAFWGIDTKSVATETLTVTMGTPACVITTNPPKEETDNSLQSAPTLNVSSGHVTLDSTMKDRCISKKTDFTAGARRIENLEASRQEMGLSAAEASPTGEGKLNRRITSGDAVTDLKSCSSEAGESERFTKSGNATFATEVEGEESCVADKTVVSSQLLTQDPSHSISDDITEFSTNSDDAEDMDNCGLVVRSDTEIADEHTETDDVTPRDQDEVAMAAPPAETQEQQAPEHLLLTLEEAFFLSYGLGCLSVMDDAKRSLTLTEMWQTFIARRSDFLPHYIVYHNLRSKGWVAKPGLQFGADYVVYKDGPPFYHATYSVIVKMVNDSDLEGDLDFQQMSLTWTSLAGLNRITESVHKEMMICYVIKPSHLTADDLKSPKCISHFKVQEVIMRRWVSAKERENAEHYEIP